MLRLLSLILLFAAVCQAAPAPKTSKEALQNFHDLIGSWKGTGLPQGTREEKERGMWIETVDWQWQFKDGDSWLRGEVAKGKHFTTLVLRYVPASSTYKLEVTTTAKEKLTFEGKFESKRLTVDRTDAKTKTTHRLVFSLLHSNRHLYRYETKPADHSTYTQVYQVGATKQGVAFASEDKGPECIVSGGLGTMAVSYKGKTYYVCCSGCRDAFKDDPEKYIKEAAKK